MSYVEKFYREGSITINVDYEAIAGSPIICLDHGLWYKFQIEQVEELDDHTFNITTSKLVSIDDKLISE